MKKPSAKHSFPNPPEIKCPECDGAGFAPVEQPSSPAEKSIPRRVRNAVGRDA